MISGGHTWAVLTAPESTGTRMDYLTRLLSQMKAQGLTGSTGLHVFADTQRRGECWNLLRALRAGYDDGAARVTVLEDDIEICANAVKRIDATAVPPDCAFISWFDSFLGRPHLGNVGPFPAAKVKEPIPEAPCFVRRIGALFYGAQALTFPRSTVKTILESDLTRLWSQANEGDTLLAQILRHERYAVHVPSLVQHVGELSLCNAGEGLKPNRISHHYRGRDFDALTLGVFP